MMNIFPSARAPVSVPESASTVIEALPGQVALLDANGTVTAVNEGWRRFARANGYQGEDYGVGAGLNPDSNNCRQSTSAGTSP